ncbi:MAG: c-type cytochrome domain-containing protein, partial [Verrucomicrobiota bacterium]
MKSPIFIALSMMLLTRESIADEADGIAFFEAKVRPLLVERCIECHGPEKQKGGLRLDSHAGWLAGGEHGTPVVTGKPGESLLIKAMRSADNYLQIHSKENGGKLGETEIAVLTQWVKMGAPDPRGAAHSRQHKARRFWSIFLRLR